MGKIGFWSITDEIDPGRDNGRVAANGGLALDKDFKGVPDEEMLVMNDD